jgi:hypothetical protein
MMSHNRLVFATSFAILAMATIGFDALQQGTVAWRWWFWLPVGLLAMVLVWCIFRMLVLPEPIASQLGQAIRSGYQLPGIFDDAGVRRIQANHMWCYGVAAMFCVGGLATWLLIWFRDKWRAYFCRVIVFFVLADLVWFAYGRRAQCDPSLYYPPIPALEEVAKAEPGRVVGHGCLPAALAQTHGLRDIRGYDGVDPARLMSLIGIFADPKSPVLPYALVQWMAPKLSVTPTGEVQFSPVMDMLGIRYVIFRGTPPPKVRPDFRSDDYWVLVNRNALPRVFVPERVETVVDDKERLAELAAASFNPRKVAFVEQPVQLPEHCRGSAEIVSEVPSRIVVSLDMETPGLLVLSDLWNSGWNAYLNDELQPILQTNHALRGVVVPKGKASLEFRYEPLSVVLAARVSALACGILVTWCGAAVWRRRIGGKKNAGASRRQ